MKPTIVYISIFDIGACVPKDWTDQQVIEFVEKENPCGTTGGWQIRKQGDRLLAGADERVVCNQYKDNVHIMLDA
ncbi:hypothetical protein KA005_59090 [bacterium]|nr:hypothetical protein [bacterium]